VTGHHADALAKLVQFTRKHPNHFMAWFARGMSHEYFGQSPDAAAAFSVCIALKPEIPQPHFNRGLTSLRQRDFQAAEEDLTEALRLEPNWTEALVARGQARQGRQGWGGAEGGLTAGLDKTGGANPVR